MLRFFFKGYSQISPIDELKGIKAPFYALFQKIRIFNSGLHFIINNMTVSHAPFGMSVIFDRFHYN